MHPPTTHIGTLSQLNQLNASAAESVFKGAALTVRTALEVIQRTLLSALRHERERKTQRERQRERESKRARSRERESERERASKQERKKERETEIERKEGGGRESVCVHMCMCVSVQLVKRLKSLYRLR